jgi:hypothetical protein
MGPFTYAPNNPFLRKPAGLVTGPAHRRIVEGPDGNLWQDVGSERICILTKQFRAKIVAATLY